MNQNKAEILAVAIARQKAFINDLEKRTKEIMANEGQKNGRQNQVQQLGI